jgi:hypothetical protein
MIETIQLPFEILNLFDAILEETRGNKEKDR